MRTEEIQRTPRSQDPNEVSRALQDLTPVSCMIVNRRGRPVPLSSAGHVLRLGKSYHLRVVTPYADDDVAAVRVVSPPDFITVEPELREIDDQGRAVRDIPLKVSINWLAQIARLNLGVQKDDLEISYVFRPGLVRQPPRFLCPIVARPGWTVLVTALLFGLFSVILQRVLTDFMFPEHRAETLRLFFESLIRWDSWLWLVGIAVPVWALVTLVNWLALHKRCRELEAAFQENYPLDQCIAERRLTARIKGE